MINPSLAERFNQGAVGAFLSWRDTVKICPEGELASSSYFSPKIMSTVLSF